MGKRIWTPERINELTALIADGHPATTIAQHFGVTAEGLNRIARRYNVRFTDHRWSIWRISKLFGFATKTLAKDFEAANIRFRHTNESPRCGPVPFLSQHQITTWLQSPQGWCTTNGYPIPQEWQDIITAAQAPYTWVSVNEMRRIAKCANPRSLRAINTHNWTEADSIRKRGGKRYLYRKDVVMQLLEGRKT